MFEVSCKLGTSLQVKLSNGESLEASDPTVVSVTMLGPIFVVKTIAIGRAVVAFKVNGAVVDDCTVTVTA